MFFTAGVPKQAGIIPREFLSFRGKMDGNLKLLEFRRFR